MAYFQTPGVAIVTGAASGIGHGCTTALALSHATTIIFADLNLPGAQSAAEASKALATNPSYVAEAVALDVTSPSSVDALVTHVKEKYGRIDYLVNAAGVDVATYATTPNLDVADYDRVMEINAKGMLLVSQAVIRVMKGQEPRKFTLPTGGERELGRGSIVNVTSALGHVALPGKGAYTVSKHAATGLTKQMATDVAPSLIRINALSPAWVRTPMFAAECAKAPGTDSLAAKVCPPGRVAEVDEVGNSAVYLLSPAGGYVSGASLMVDYGLSVGPKVL